MDCRSKTLPVALIGALLLLSAAVSAEDAPRLPDRPIPPAPAAAMSDQSAYESFSERDALAVASNTATATSSSDTPTARPSLSYEPNWPAPPNLSSVLIRLVVGTAFTIVLCGGTLWFGRRWLQKTNVLPGGPSNREMILVESTRLGGHCVVHLLQIGDQRVLVGTDRTGLQSIVPMPEAFGGVLDDQFDANDSDDSAVSTNPLRAFPGEVANARPRIIRTGLNGTTSSNSIEQV